MTHPTNVRDHHRWALTLLGWVAVALVVVLLAGCGTGGDSEDSSQAGGDSDNALTEERPAEGESAARDEDRAAAEQDAPAGEDIAALARSAIQNADLIKRADLELRTDEVSADRTEVIRVTESHGGFVAEQEAYRDSDGEASDARLVLRIPVDEFESVVDALEKVATATSSSISTEDVTAKLTDTEVRIAAQRASLERVRALLDRAESIDDIVSIEAELTRRQADLDSLLRTQARLSDQTDYSTVSVSLFRASDQPAEEEDDRGGFLGGLSAGWGALLTFFSGLGVAAGLLLPWLILLALLAVPVWWAVRRRRTRASAAPVAGPPPPPVAG